MDWIVTNQMNVNCEAYTKESWPPLIPGPWKKKKKKGTTEINLKQVGGGLKQGERKSTYVPTRTDRQT